MERFLRPAILVLSLAIQSRACAGDAAKPTPAWSPKAAATYLDGRAKEWLNWSGAARGQGTVCLSCHTAMPIALARAALAERLGEKTPGPVEKALLDNVKKRVANWNK